MICRDHTPVPEDCVDRIRADAHRYHDELIALGGRSTRPIKQYPDYGTIATDGKKHYRDEYEKIEVIFEVDNDRSSSHWAEEMDRCGHELRRWQIFKEAQRHHNQNGRSELELELENTDPALVGVLNKLNDWQEFESMQQRAVHEAEKFLEKCQQGNAKSQNAMVAATYADPMLKLQEPTGGWKRCMRQAQEKLDTSQNKLIWVKSQWNEVIAEACSLIAAAPNLQDQLEAKFEKRTRAVYRTLQQQGARPSHAVYPPNKDVEFPHRLQHWITESSAFVAELRDWRIFMLWRRNIRDAGNLNQDERKVLSEGDSSSEVFEDLVKYQQHELEKALSWVDCWRGQLRKHLEASRGIWRYGRSSNSRDGPGWPFCGRNDHIDDDDDDDDDSSDDEGDITEARRAEVYVMHAEAKVSIAAKRLEESKQKLQGILAESGPPSTSQNPAAYTEIQTPPTQPKSSSPEGLRKSRRPSKKKSSGGNEYHRSKKERARRREADMANANTEQHALPKVSLDSNNLDEDDEDTQMSNDAQNPSPIEIKKESTQKDSEDAVMSDAEERTDRLPSSPPGSHPRPIPQMDYTKVPSSSSPSPISRRTRSATKLDQVPSGKVLKKPSKNKPTKKAEVFTVQQQMALLNAAATEHPTADPTSLGRIEHNPYPSPPTSTHNSQNSSPPSSRLPTSRKNRPAKELNRVSARKIRKNSNKDKPRKKAKTFTEERTQMLLHAATSRSHSTGPTSPGETVMETYPTTHTSANTHTKPSPGSPSLISKETHSAKQVDQIPSGKLHNNLNQNKSRKKAKTLTNQQTPAQTNAAPANCPPASSHTLRRSERLKKKAAADRGRV